ncbi:hypothetical protein ACFQL4_22425 [Halosimplex aquaticum]
MTGGSRDDDGGGATDGGDGDRGVAGDGAAEAGTVSILDAGPASVSMLGADGGTDEAAGDEVGGRAGSSTARRPSST